MATQLGERLAQARQRLGWGLREAERRTGVNNAHLIQIEQGKIARPDPNVLWTLANAYGEDFDELMVLAGHVTVAASAQPMFGVALRAYGQLTPAQQREVIEYMTKLKEGITDAEPRK